MQVNYLNMIGHGTTGSDGIEEGIHLRWAFNDKLGFPACFKLYRRESNPGNRHEFYIAEFPPGKLPLPYKSAPPGFQFGLVSALVNGEDVAAVNVEKRSPEPNTIITVIRINGELKIVFSENVSRIELVFYATENSNFQIIAQSDEADYLPHHFWPASQGLKNVSFDAPGTTGIILRGNGINLNALAVWLCYEKGDEWERINMDCGCGLPVNQDRNPYIEENYPLLIGTDLAIALCRLGYRTVENSPLTATEFVQLKAILLSMLPEGSLVPVGWTLFDGEEDTGNEDTGEQMSLEFSKYDYLLAQSLHVSFAAILGLYYIDKDVNKNKYYDYKVSAEWPAANKRRLSHQILFEDYQAGYTFFPIFALNEQVVFSGTAAPVIVEENNALARTTLGLNISSGATYSMINFTKPVTEVQLFLVNPDFSTGASTIAVEAYKNFLSIYIDRAELQVESGILRLRAPQIDSIRIYGSNIVVCRLHYDFEPFPVGLQEYSICGLIKQAHVLPPRPTELTASFIPGGTVTNNEGMVTEKPYLAGLRWDVNEDPERKMISLAPVLYHLARKAEGGTVELLTADSPLFVSPSSLEDGKRDIPIGWPEERQFYSEQIEKNKRHFYQAAALDLFGRQSRFTEFTTYELKPPRSPHPTDVAAQFLDYSTYNAGTQTFSDKTINTGDQRWLLDNKKNAIVIRWKWPENLQLQAPDTEGFIIHFKQGWLNTYTGIIVSGYTEAVVTKTSLNLTAKECEQFPVLALSAENIKTYKFQTVLSLGEVALQDMFRLCWMNQGSNCFLVLKNGSGDRPVIWVLMPASSVSFVPVKEKGFGIPVTAGKKYFIDYTEPANWVDKTVLQIEQKNLSPKLDPVSTAYPIYQEDYTVYIEDPAFPIPHILETDKDKVRYAQIGVTSFIKIKEGTVSAPSTIMAIYREIPAASRAFVPLKGQAIYALKATPANVYGKSSFALRWSKIRTGVKHHVYRALDETLFAVDNNMRQTRNNDIYDTFKTDHPEFIPVDVELIRHIPYESKPALVATHYAALTAGQLQILASLPDNVAAFTKINDKAIDENDPFYADRGTEIPDPANGATYSPDPANICLFTDVTLNGNSSNKYFFALRSVDSNGLQSNLSLATPPVEIPKTTPPPAPVIISVNGGENKVIVQWAKYPGAPIKGYLLYRANEKKYAHDWRRMELIKSNEADKYTVEVGNVLPDEYFEFTDAGTVARQPYYYAVVAIGLNDEGKWLRSNCSLPKAGQAYDLAQPQPPEWDEVNSGWVYVDDEGTVHEWDADLTTVANPIPAIRLVWIDTNQNSLFHISRQKGTNTLGMTILNFETGEYYQDGYKMFIDRSAALPDEHMYSGKTKSAAGLTSAMASTIEINQQ